MTPQELEDQIISKMETTYDKVVEVSNARNMTIALANATYEHEMHELDIERLRILMQHTVEVFAMKGNS